MGRIPTVTSQVAARTGRTTQGVPSPRANANTFGAPKAAGLRNLGAGLDDLASGIDAFAEAKKREEVANQVAQSDFTRQELEIRNQTGADAEGYQEAVLDAYDAWVDEKANEIEDDGVRQEYVRRMRASRRDVSARAASYEFGTAATHSKNQANLSLTSLDNRIRLQPDMYDDLVEQGVDVIMARGDLPATTKEAMAAKWRQDSAMARFEGALESAESMQDIELLERELQQEGNPWVERLATGDLDRIISTIGTSKRAFRTAADAAARAAIDGLEERAGDPTVRIPQAELQAAQELVSKSENPVTQARMARIVRDQRTARQYRHSTPSEMRSGARRAVGYGMDPENRRQLSEAGSAFGVSLEYMTRVAGRGTGTIGLYAEAIASIESKGSGNYRAVGPETSNGRAYGRYQVMSFNIGPWTEKHVGRRMTPEEFLNDPDAQDAVFAGQFGSYVEKYGDPVKAARAWFGFGESDGYTSGSEYETRFANYISSHSSKTGAGVDKDFVDRALATPGVRERLGGDETPARVAAAYAAVAREAFIRTFGRGASDEELYIAHTKGINEAVSIVTGHRDGDPAASKAYAEAVREYAEAGPDNGVSASSYAQSELLRKMAKDAETRINNDPMSYANQTGTFQMGSLNDEDGFAQRGQDARDVADYYSIPYGEMKPFTEDEAAAMGKMFKEGDADDILNILSAVQQMGGDMSRAAMRQLSDVDDVYGYAGSLNLGTGQRATAADVVRGQKRLEENPDIRKQIGANEEEMYDAFATATGGALMAISPRQRQAIAEAAVAHYVETQVTRGQAGTFDAEKFGASVQAVLGATRGNAAIDEVNGVLTALPPGVSGEALEEALQNMTVADWAAFSMQGLPPRYVDGSQADPADLADEAILRTVGAGRYQVMMGDGSYLITGRPAESGRLELYVFEPTAERVQVVNTRDRRSADGVADTTDIDNAIQSAIDNGEGVSHLEYRALVEKYGADAVEEWVRRNQ